MTAGGGTAGAAKSENNKHQQIAKSISMASDGRSVSISAGGWRGDNAISIWW
jgi:hypothetical protein